MASIRTNWSLGYAGHDHWLEAVRCALERYGSSHRPPAAHASLLLVRPATPVLVQHSALRLLTVPLSLETRGVRVHARALAGCVDCAGPAHWCKTEAGGFGHNFVNDYQRAAIRVVGIWHTPLHCDALQVVEIVSPHATNNRAVSYLVQVRVV
jgi:hypothetical protein